MLQESSQNWLKQVSLVALKASSLSTSKDRFMTLLVSDRQDMTNFTPGLTGGQRYLLQKQISFCETEDMQMTASLIKKLFSELKCFLLPKYSTQTNHKQQMSALLRLVLEQEPPIHTDEDNKAGQVIRTLLDSLNALSSYIDIDQVELKWLAEPNRSSYEDEKNDIKSTESDAEDPDSQWIAESTFSFRKPSEKCKEDLLKLKDIASNVEDDIVDVQTVEVEIFADLKKYSMTNSRMASSRELEENHVFEGFGDPNDFLQPDVNSQIVCLLTVTGSNGDSLTVNEQGLDSFLSRLRYDPVLVHVCIGTDSAYNSSLISKLLGFAKKSSSGTATSSYQRIATEELSQVFSKHREEVSQQCLVAWAEPVKGEIVGGKSVSHVFLDIWGKFKKNDPVYTVLAGIATAMSNSVVHIVQNELEVITHFYYLIVLFCNLFESQHSGTINDNKMLTWML
jgi:hypothetical protein